MMIRDDLSVGRVLFCGPGESDSRTYFTNGFHPFFEYSGSVKPIASISWILSS